MKQVVKVAKIGENALSIDPNDFVFHSDYNTFKIIGTGVADFEITADSTEINTITHGMGYTPLVNAFMKVDTNDEVICTNCKFDNPSYQNVGFLSVSSDATKIYFEVINGKLTNITVYLRYYIFEVPM